MADLGRHGLPRRPDRAEGDLGTQFAALCWRARRGGVQILLVTSRGTGRWIAPKGWPIEGLTPAEAAAQEAWEEAGVVGRADERCLGLYTYSKVLREGGREVGGLPCAVSVFAVEVERLARDFPEAGQRRRRWMSPGEAARRVAEPELARLIAGFDPMAGFDPAAPQG